MSETKNVWKIYDKVASWFDRERSRDLSFELRHLKMFTKNLKPGASILDLGCGTGRPMAEYLVQNGFHVTGVDASREMLELAKTYVPKAEFRLQDMRKLELGRKFDAIVMWHSFFHLEVEDQRQIFTRLENHLNLNGQLMFTSGTENGEAWGEIDGEKLHHASLSVAEYKTLLAKHNFKLESLTLNDKSSGGATVWLASLFGDTAK